MAGLLAISHTRDEERDLYEIKTVFFKKRIPSFGFLFHAFYNFIYLSFVTLTGNRTRRIGSVREGISRRQDLAKRLTKAKFIGKEACFWW